MIFYKNFKLKRIAMINKDRVFFQYNSGDLVYIISPLTSQLCTTSRKIMIKYVGPIVVYKIVDPHNYYFYGTFYAYLALQYICSTCFQCDYLRTPLMTQDRNPITQKHKNANAFYIQVLLMLVTNDYLKCINTSTYIK